MEWMRFVQVIVGVVFHVPVTLPEVADGLMTFFLRIAKLMDEFINADKCFISQAAATALPIYQV